MKNKGKPGKYKGDDYQTSGLQAEVGLNHDTSCIKKYIYFVALERLLDYLIM